MSADDKVELKSTSSTTKDRQDADDHEEIVEMTARKFAAIDLAPNEKSDSKPSIPAKSDVHDAYQHYKTQLMSKPKSQLPAEIVVDNPEHFNIFNGVLQNLPNAEGKIGCGLKGFKINRCIAVGGEDVCCCYVIRTDGTEEDFSLFKIYRRKDTGNRFDSKTCRVYRRSSKHKTDEAD